MDYLFRKALTSESQPRAEVLSSLLIAIEMRTTFSLRTSRRRAIDNGTWKPDMYQGKPEHARAG